MCTYHNISIRTWHLGSKNIPGYTWSWTSRSPTFAKKRPYNKHQRNGNWQACRCYSDRDAASPLSEVSCQMQHLAAHSHGDISLEARRWNVHDKSVGQPQTLLAHRSARIEWCLPGRYRLSKRKSGIVGYTTHANSDLLWTSGLIHTPWLFHLKLPSTANEPGSCDLHIWRWRSQLSQAKRRRLHDFRVFARHFSVATPCLIRLQFFTLRIEQATHTWRERQKIARVKIHGKK